MMVLGLLRWDDGGVVADTTGITLAGLTSVFLTPALCRWQVAHGRPPHM
jgi:hypothetical protein